MAVSAGHFFLGSEGLALLRTWLSGDEAALGARVGEIASVVGAPDAPPLALRFEVADLDVGAGYARWAATYDGAPNPLIRTEQPVVRALIDRARPGDALDAACGTGRHTEYLAARGHRVTGVDGSPEMLAKARERVPGADLRAGDLGALPFAAESFDLAVCALALTHLPDIGPPSAEMARVLRPDGRLVLSDFHPTMLLLGGTGFFVGADGGAGNVRSYHHPIARYLAAFRAAGLEVLDCVEPVLAEQDLPAASGGLSGLAEDAFRAAWLGLPNALVWELARR
ncbi:MAG: methyltransferase domain-containing protein [Thermodesulfobacteriota bacterium]